MTKLVVAVVGAGVAGSLTAAALLRQSDSEVTVRLIDAAESTGRGDAFGTVDARHLTNVPVARMSADPDDPDDFLRWLRRRKDPMAAVTDYVPRQWFGEYVEHHLSTAAGASAGTLYRINDDVFSIVSVRGRYRVRCRNGLSLMADAVVLAVGAPRPDHAWLPSALTGSPRFCPDPWNPELLHRATADADRVLFIGAGLTMADLAISLDRPGRVMMAISRTGLLPAAHADRSPPGILPPPVLPPGPLTRGDAERVVSRQVREALSQYGDWRPGIDSLRPLSDELWRRLSLADQRTFAHKESRPWEVRRHRLAPESARRLRDILAAGRLRVRVGTVSTVRRARGRSIQLVLSDGFRPTAHAVIDCTGPALPERVRDAGNPVIADLVGSGLARINDQGLGLDTDPDGAVRSADGRPQPRLRVVGAYRRGPIWETTAVPQIRAQALRTATEVLRLIAPSREAALRGAR